MYTWHVTFDDKPAVQEIAARAQARLAGLPGLDLVPGRWLHLTVQGVGFTDEAAASEVRLIVNSARTRLASLPPLRVTLGPARVASEGVALDVSPRGELAALRARLRTTIAEVLAADRLLETEEWTPHVSIAYCNTSAGAGPYVAALAGEHNTAEVRIDQVQLIVLGRDHHSYEWTVYEDARLTGNA